MVLAITLVVALQSSGAQALTANLDDVKSVDTIVASLYHVISGPAGQKRDWNRFRSLFSPKGTLAALVKDRDGRTKLVTMTPEDYINGSGPILERNGFFEREVRRKTQKTMDMVQIFSDYESGYSAQDKKPFQVGTNAIQAYTDGTRWYIHSVLWQGKEVKN
jgi:hypothetical protein